MLGIVYVILLALGSLFLVNAFGKWEQRESGFGWFILAFVCFGVDMYIVM